MALAAAQVIDVLAARLVPLPATAGRVYTSRAWPLAESDLPAWRVVANAESVQRSYLGSLDGEHTLQIECRAYARAASDLDDTLHALAAGALPLLFASPVPHDLQLTLIDRQLQTEGAADVGVLVLGLTARFVSSPLTPESIL